VHILFLPSWYPDERFTFLNIAGLHEKKGHADLPEAFAAAFRNDDSTELIVGGEGDLRGSLESMAVRLGVSDRVRFVGQLSRGGFSDG
jgi:glycosyltransferase involved in cell wall biosynthesis